MASTLNRALKRVKKHEVRRMNAHLEKLGAAFVRETGLLASETALVQRDNPDGTKEYAFGKRTFHPADCSSEVRSLFEAVVDLVGAETTASKEEGIKLLREFVEQYKE